MKNKLLVGIFLLLGAITLAGAGCAVTNQTTVPADQPADMMQKEDVMKDSENKDAMMDTQKTENSEDTAMMEKDSMMDAKEKTMAEKDAVMEAEKAGMYTDYSPSSLAEATKNGGKAVLFFWASWCPDCKAANADFLANADKIPHNVTVLKTNYDTEKALKTKYGVTYQHTFIQVDAGGNQISRWNGGGVAELVSNLK